MNKILLLGLFLLGINAYAQKTITEDQQIYKNGLSKIKAKDYQGAIEDFSNVLEIDPKNENAYFNRGRAKALMNQYGKAIEDYDKVLKMNPESTKTLYQRGQVKYALKNYQEAIDDYSTILEIDPDMKAVNWVYIYRGLCYSALQNHDEAVTDYMMALDIVFTSNDMRFTGAWPDFDQIQTMQQSFEATSMESHKEPADEIIGIWQADGPFRSGSLAEFKNNGTVSYPNQGVTSYKVIYSAHNSYMIMLDSASVPFGHMVVKVIDDQRIGIKELWDFPGSQVIQVVDEYKKYEESTLKPWNKKSFTIALKMLGIKEQDSYEFRGRKINVSSNSGIQIGGSDYYSNLKWDKETEAIKLYKAMDSLKASGTLLKISNEAIKVASYLDPIDPFEGYLPISLILLEKERYNDAAFLFELGMMREAYYESVNPSSYRPNGSKRESEYNTFDEDFESKVYAFLKMDIDNFLFVLQTVHNYFEANDYAPEPRKDNEEKYTAQLQESKEFIERVKDPEDYPQTYMEDPSYFQELIKSENERIERSKSISVANKNIVGSWTGKWGEGYKSKKEFTSLASFDADGNCEFPVGDNTIIYQIQEFDQDYTDKYLRKLRNYKGTYTIDYNQDPIQILGEIKIPGTEEIIKVEYIAEFLDEDVLKIGASYLNNPTKFIYDRTRILTREIPGAKNYFDYKIKYPTLADNTSKVISDEELKLFWSDIIDPIIEKDTSAIINNTHFPLKSGNESLDSARFKEYGIRSLFWQDVNMALRDLDYTYLDQVELEPGEPALMLYLLGRPSYEYYSDGNRKYYIKLGLMFVKQNGNWKLYNMSSGVSSGEFEDISQNRKFLLNQVVKILDRQLFFQSYISPLVSMNKDEVLKTVQFPLGGNWGNALGYTNNSSEWGISDFSDNMWILFNEYVRTRLNLGVFMLRNDEPPTREAWIHGGTVKINGKEYKSSLSITYTQIDDNWKLTKLDWEGRSKTNEDQLTTPKLTSEEFEKFTIDYIKPIIELDNDKIIEQANFPLEFNGKPISMEEFKIRSKEIFTQKFRDYLKDLDAKSVRIQNKPGKERKINGIYVQDPGETFLGVQIRRSDLQGVLLYKKEDDMWILDKIYLQGG